MTRQLINFAFINNALSGSLITNATIDPQDA